MLTEILTDVAEIELHELEGALTDLGRPAFHARQIFQWTYRRGITDFGLMTDLPRDLRAELSQRFRISTPEIIHREQSSDGTTKFLLELADGKRIESVCIPDSPSGLREVPACQPERAPAFAEATAGNLRRNPARRLEGSRANPGRPVGASGAPRARERNTFCVSTQVGCAMRCAFCLTGKMGIDRNLSAGEIAGQVRVLAGALGLLDCRFNIVLMGMGEPLHNYDATMKALRMLSNEHGFAVSPRRVTLSTVGVLPALERLATESFMPNLAISLHSTTEAQRDLLVPINRKYGIEELLDACRRFPIKRRQRITFEYVMLAGVNDTPEDAARLARLLTGIQAKVNLLPLNEAAGIPFERPSEEAVNRFGRILSERGVTVSVRKSRGRDIRAACGQLITESSTTQAPGKQLAMLM